jgi:hypothetical protein
MSSAYEDGRAGRPRDDLQWDANARNAYEEGRRMQARIDSIGSSNGSGSAGVAHAAPMTLRSCLGGIAFLILFPVVTLTLVFVGVGVYEAHEDARAEQLWRVLSTPSAPQARPTASSAPKRPKPGPAKQSTAPKREARDAAK